MQCLVFVLPLGTLSYYQFVQRSVPKDGFFDFVVALAASLVLFNTFRSWRKLYQAFVQAGRMSAAIIIIVAAIGLQAARLSLAGFLIPFVFVYHPEVPYKLQALFVICGTERPNSQAMMDILLFGRVDLGWIVLAFAVSIWLLTSALAGFEKNGLPGAERILRAVVGLVLPSPDVTFAVPALVAAIVPIVGHRFLNGEPPAVDRSREGKRA